MSAESPPRVVALGDHLRAVRAGLRRDLAVAAAALTVLRRLLAEPDRYRLAIEFDRIAKDLESHLRYEGEASKATDPATLRD
ncbi:hypothetical protein [Nocardia brasiliensis]|uniref:Uncharacterized protein n=1 Tax=Nocardia brasiliensis (strain ATCC 700358 / HUJEG-1) TaxID=1133849 RepID=K0F7F4_NOCB7|nr:hypothetical protein [Nocardia brasiliensis]AFU05654.1 hypothetical protein O3I_038535 [Nocardia brasiliensis ATCC 700358]OCF89860.1 hypothetical protein AW168_11910 [Nocardia brasiliensis]